MVPDAYLTGLLEAWCRGYPHVVLEVDSLEAMRLLRNDSTMDERCSIMWYLLDLQRRNWVVRLNHIPLNLYKLADSLAKLPTSDSLDLIVFDTPLISVRHLLDTEVVS
ncbi:hypothetical protein V6N12_030021 [Hibiscus sabdariffa]|uniref:RNase H type-1 domain-containing protein n=1 Tax=Hibiscus sabdariffa TaxID=183260 RepID=A0ABR2CJD5_9ROSI